MYCVYIDPDPSFNDVRQMATGIV